MKRETRLALNALNQRFYRERAEEFSGTRKRPWKGWVELHERIARHLPQHLRVLDVGCGNGRFARFLRDALDRPFAYVGVDQSPIGLAEARRRLADLSDVRLVEHDFVASESIPALGSFDLVVLFGVLHHVPGRASRGALLRKLGGHLTPGGLLAFTAWRFDRYERFRKKLVPLEAAGLDLDASDLERGDFIMAWGNAPPALRYCHAVSDEELDALVAGTDLPVLERFDAADEPNTYVVLAPGR